MANPSRPGGLRPIRMIPPLLVAVSLFTVLLSTGTLKESGKGFGLALAGGIQKGITYLGQAVSGSVAVLRGRRELYEQYAELAQRIDDYSSLEREHAELRAENQRLKEQLGYARGGSTQLIPARIIAKDPDSLYNSFTIDQGKRDGIGRGMPVIAFQGGIDGIVGKIVEVSEGSSLVIPIYDKRLFLSARLARTRDEGLVGGQGKTNDPLVMKYVGKLAASELQFGDMVVTSGYNSIYPPDIAIGRVRRVALPEYESSAEIYIDPVIDMGKLEFVFAMKALPAEPDAPQGQGNR